MAKTEKQKKGKNHTKSSYLRTASELPVLRQNKYRVLLALLVAKLKFWWATLFSQKSMAVVLARGAAFKAAGPDSVELAVWKKQLFGDLNTDPLNHQDRQTAFFAGNYYAVLELPHYASEERIVQARKRLLLALHPDKTTDRVLSSDEKGERTLELEWVMEAYTRLLTCEIKGCPSSDLQKEKAVRDTMQVLVETYKTYKQRIEIAHERIEIAHERIEAYNKTFEMNEKDLNVANQRIRELEQTLAAKQQTHGALQTDPEAQEQSPRPNAPQQRPKSPAFFQPVEVTPSHSLPQETMASPTKTDIMVDDPRQRNEQVIGLI